MSRFCGCLSRAGSNQDLKLNGSNPGRKENSGTAAPVPTPVRTATLSNVRLRAALPALRSTDPDSTMTIRPGNGVHKVQPIDKGKQKAIDEEISAASGAYVGVRSSYAGFAAKTDVPRDYVAIPRAEDVLANRKDLLRRLRQPAKHDQTMEETEMRDLSNGRAQYPERRGHQ